MCPHQQRAESDTAVVVIGGGSTGCGIARNLAMRGIGVTLCERDGLGRGTSGRSHGLLHSGARYAESDPEGARECILESRTLKRIAGECIRDSGGYFLQVAGDDPAYFQQKRAACEDVGYRFRGSLRGGRPRGGARAFLRGRARHGSSRRADLPLAARRGDREERPRARRTRPHPRGRDGSPRRERTGHRRDAAARRAGRTKRGSTPSTS